MMHLLVPRDSFIGIVIGPATWFAFFLVAYLITGAGCTLEFARINVAGVNLLRLLVFVFGVIAMLIIVPAGVQAWRQWREPDGREEVDAQRHRFIDLASAMLCAASLLGTLWLLAAVAITPMCQEAL